MSTAWLLAGISVCLGGSLFCGMLWKSLHPPEENTQNLKVDVEKARQVALSVETTADDLRRENEQLARDVIALRTANTQHSERLEKFRLTTRSMEDENARRTTALREETKNLQDQAAAANRNKEEMLQGQKTQADLQAALLNSTGAMATIASLQGNLASGCLIHTPERPLIFTVLPADTATDGLLVKLNVAIPNLSTNTHEAVFKAQPVHFDKETSLTVLTFSFTGRLSLKAFQSDIIVDAKAGEKVFMIGAQLMGAQVAENNIYEGTISATNRQIGNTKYLQVAMPGNFGMNGAPLLNANRELVGILKSAVEGLERTSIAIPASDILRVYRSIKQE